MGKAGQRFQDTREEARLRTTEAPRPRRTSQRKSAEHGPVGLCAVKSTVLQTLCRAREGRLLSGLSNISRATGRFLLPTPLLPTKSPYPFCTLLHVFAVAPQAYKGIGTQWPPSPSSGSGSVALLEKSHEIQNLLLRLGGQGTKPFFYPNVLRHFWTPDNRTTRRPMVGR